MTARELAFLKQHPVISRHEFLMMAFLKLPSFLPRSHVGSIWSLHTPPRSPFWRGSSLKPTIVEGEGGVRFALCSQLRRWGFVHFLQPFVEQGGIRPFAPKHRGGWSLQPTVVFHPCKQLGRGEFALAAVCGRGSG
uniref:Uncharacterized protein n=1 Tax=Pyxicephalus adspersus TaxID=30357 RepID=A0AAV2ZXC7_PYXAD|nr:TPA: hypothetical protein GDO54_002312 [Pyxicephalus adspersus]